MQPCELHTCLATATQLGDNAAHTIRGPLVRLSASAGGLWLSPRNGVFRRTQKFGHNGSPFEFAAIVAYRYPKRGSRLQEQPKFHRCFAKLIGKTKWQTTTS